MSFTATQPEPFDLKGARELGRRSRMGRLGFAAAYAVVSLVALPPVFVGAWISAILAWELSNGRLLDWIVNRLPDRTALNAYAACNVFGGCIFFSIVLVSLSIGTPVAIAIAATWLAGSFMNAFIYFGQNRRMLLASIGPGVVAAIIGPAIPEGPTLTGGVTSALLIAFLAIARNFSTDHQVLRRSLAERQGALAAVERKLLLAVEASGDGLFEMDLIARTNEASAGWAAMLGYAKAELEGIDLITLVHPDDREAVDLEYRRHFAGETPHTTSELRMRCKDGSYKWVLSRASLVARTFKGEPWRVVGTSIDMSARKAMEHQLEAARDAAEQANSAKSMFVANMSHEIRTPLNGVIGVAGALARTPLSPDQGEMVGLIRSSAQVLERLLSDVLDQSKLEAGEFQLQEAPFDLREAIEASAELMRQRADDQGLRFEITYGDEADGLFLGDAVRLRQIVSNLAANAIKFTERGGVRIFVDAAGADAESLVTITVADTGIGFDEAAGERLFSRFVQADGSISRRFGGTGLGLAICKALTERMGGQIAAQSTPGIGSVFTVTLPLPRTEPLAAYLTRARSHANEEAEEVSLAGLRVLLAEDHPTNQRVVQLILGPAGVDLTVVGDGRQAVDAFRTAAFDVVLMDMQMPDMDGLAATREIRRLEQASGAARTPIAMLTANATDEHRAIAAEAGADLHIAKPITPESLLEGLAEAVSQAAPGAVRAKAAG